MIAVQYVTPVLKTFKETCQRQFKNTSQAIMSFLMMQLSCKNIIYKLYVAIFAELYDLFNTLNYIIN
jgi:hypothetical protein